MHLNNGTGSPKMKMAAGTGTALSLHLELVVGYGVHTQQNKSLHAAQNQTQTGWIPYKKDLNNRDNQSLYEPTA